ncbi:hypothetical protein HYALB_00008721 [Hymenoscyphus albidus]|uniref:NmrA-like domain-containing protein n=1 Tax=Hymenoscyphus albidus TaxID=595503 RepID=A0A9N9LLG8_9HELO|nr:hypothetical protein HYALB_00008721 [Hymenoscyphus albidus]
MAGFLKLDGPIDEVQEAVIPGDGLNAWVNREELGIATGRIVGNWENYINKTVTLTGQRTYTMRQIIDLYVAHTGKRVNFRVLPVDEVIKYHIKHKILPPGQESFLSNWVTMHKAWELGEADYVDPSLGDILGRPPKTLEDQADEIFSEGNKLDTKDFAKV